MRNRNLHYLVHPKDLDRIDRMLSLLNRFVIELIESRQLPENPDHPDGYDEFEAYLETIAAENDEDGQREFRWTGRGSIDF